MEHSKQIQIWFFIGVLLLAYGVIILGVGVYHLFHPPFQPVELHELHADIWWGAILLILGLFYSIKYRPSSMK